MFNTVHINICPDIAAFNIAASIIGSTLIEIINIIAKWIPLPTNCLFTITEPAIPMNQTGTKYKTRNVYPWYNDNEFVSIVPWYANALRITDPLLG